MVSLLKDKSEFGLIKILVKIILLMKRRHFNQQELIQLINIKINIFQLNKSKWLEILLMLFKINALKVDSQNILVQILDNLLVLMKLEDLFPKN